MFQQQIARGSIGKKLLKHQSRRRNGKRLEVHTGAASQVDGLGSSVKLQLERSGHEVVKLLKQEDELDGSVS